MRKPDYIASDLHLGAVPRDVEDTFMRFLEHAGAHAGSLLLGGDLFDFWFEWGPVVPGRYFRTLAALRAVVDAGVPVTLLGGNHDAWGGRFLREEVGVAFHRDMVRLQLGGRPALAAHGDGLGRGDLRYRMLKAVLRSRLAIAGFRVLHPELGMRLAGAVSTTEDKAKHDRGARGRARFIEEWARERLEAEPALAFIVCGHAHVPTVVEVEPGRFYLNAGDWVTHDTYITVSSSGVPALHRWSAQAARL